MITNSTEHFFKNVSKTLETLDLKKIDLLIERLLFLKNNFGRIFFIGIGGSAANCSHAVNDFRKLCNIDSICPLDNVSELSARINDEGWETSLVESLKTSRITKKDIIFIMSVGGGNIERNVSVNLIKCIDYALEKQIDIAGIVGRDGGYTYKNGNYVIKIPCIDDKLITPIVESYQALVWHCIVSDERLKSNPTKW